MASPDAEARGYEEDVIPNADFAMAQTSVIHCPGCGIESAAPMPQDACVYFWDCPASNTIVRPKAGATAIPAMMGGRWRSVPGRGKV